MNTSRIISLCILAGLAVAPLRAMETAGDYYAASQTAQQADALKAAQAELTRALQEAAQQSEATAKEVTEKAAQALAEISEALNHQKATLADYIKSAEFVKSPAFAQAIINAQKGSVKQYFVSLASLASSHIPSLNACYPWLLATGIVGLVVVGEAIHLINTWGNVTTVSKWIELIKTNKGTSAIIAGAGLASTGLVALGTYKYIQQNNFPGTKLALTKAQGAYNRAFNWTAQKVAPFIPSYVTDWVTKKTVGGLVGAGALGFGGHKLIKYYDGYNRALISVKSILPRTSTAAAVAQPVENSTANEASTHVDVQPVASNAPVASAVQDSSAATTTAAAAAAQVVPVVQQAAAVTPVANTTAPAKALPQPPAKRVTSTTAEASSAVQTQTAASVASVAPAAVTKADATNAHVVVKQPVTITRTPSEQTSSVAEKAAQINQAEVRSKTENNQQFVGQRAVVLAEQAAKAKKAEQKQALLDVANRLDVAQVSALAKNFSQDVKTAADAFIAIVKSRGQWGNNMTVDKARKNTALTAAMKLGQAFDKLKTTLESIR